MANEAAREGFSETQAAEIAGKLPVYKVIAMTDLSQQILSHLKSHTGQLTPTNKDMAKLFGCSVNTVDKYISTLKASGQIFPSGSGSSRYFYFKGMTGHTLPRIGKVYGVPPAMRAKEVIDQPQACQWCGVRGCERHGVVRPSVSHVRSWAA